MSGTFYAVRNGKKPGIYKTWAECQLQTLGFSGAIFKKFKQLKDAESFLKIEQYVQGPMKKAKIDYEEVKIQDVIVDASVIYTDGGQNKLTGMDAWGCVTNNKGKCIIYKYMGLLSDMTLIQRTLPAGERWCIVAHFNDVVSQNNNGAELLALIAGLRIALATPEVTRIYTDSQLLLKYWTRGFFNRGKMDTKKIEFILLSIDLRKQFEARGGKILKIAGKDNMADLGVGH